MAAGIGNISIGFIADTSQFMLGAQKVQSKLREVGGVAGKLGGAIGMISGPTAIIGAGLAVITAEVGFATAAIHAMIEEVHRLDEIGDKADVIGTTTSGLIHLRFAAERSGTSIEAVDLGMKKMVRTLGEARGGNKSAQGAFGRLGLSVDELSKKDPEKAFRDIAEGFKRIKNPADRAALAVEIFGKGGQELLPTLALGRSGLERMAAGADRLGMTISELDAAAINDLDNSFKDLKDSLGGLLTQVTVAFLPEMQKTVDILLGLVDAIDKNKTAIKDLVGTLVPAASVLQVIYGSGVFDRLEARGKKIREQIRVTKQESDALAATQNAINTKMVNPALEFGSQAFAEAAKSRASMANPLVTIGNEQKEILKKIEANTKPQSGRPQPGVSL